MSEQLVHKSGFVSIVGNPNVGKSTLMNALIGEKLSIITPKAQTTRSRIHGILNHENYQIVFSDTPGILKPAYLLQENMRKTALSSFSDADLILYLTEVDEKPEPDKQLLQKLKRAKVPVIIGMNKADKGNHEIIENRRLEWLELLPDAVFIPLSALKKFNLDVLLKIILGFLPEGPPYYPKDVLSDKNERFFTSEIIREKILLNYKKEIPYSVEVEIETFTEEPGLNRIRAVIYVERDSQKGILIGEKGLALKKTGTQARKALEEFFDKKVFLELFVKVSKDWRSSEKALKGFGYQ